MASNDRDQLNQRIQPVSVTKSNVSGSAERDGTLTSRVCPSVVTRAAARKANVSDELSNLAAEVAAAWQRRTCFHLTSARHWCHRAPQKTSLVLGVQVRCLSRQASIQRQRSASLEGASCAKCMAKIRTSTLQYRLVIGLELSPRLAGLGRSERSQKPSDRGAWRC